MTFTVCQFGAPTPVFSSSIVNVEDTSHPVSNTALPDQPYGLKGINGPRGKAFTILWEPVKQRVDGSPLTNLAGYNIYRRSIPRGVATKINNYLIPIIVFADRVDGKTFYYSVRAVDTNGRESADSYIVDSSPQADLFILANDGVSSIVIPGEVVDILRPSHNKYGVSLAIKLKENPIPDISGTVRDISFHFLRSDNQEDLADLAFAAPGAALHIGYNVANGIVVAGAPGAQATGRSPDLDSSTEQLCLFWSNGVDWIKLGGTDDRSEQTVTVNSSQLGSYQLRAVAKATELALEKANVFPPVFTPNGDGYNDRVYLVLENPRSSSITGKIFDLAGRTIATLPAPTQTQGTGTTLVWAGTDSNGSVVPGGMYVYRIDAEGKTITGTVAVGR